MHKVLIIGSGFSGMSLAIHLKKASIDNFVILEKADEVGGTWRENTYPGAECDVPSVLYSYSFEQNSAWQYKWSEQPQIFAYQKQIAEKYRLYEHIRFNQEAVSSSFDTRRKLWIVTTQTGDTFEAQHLVTAVGQLHHPSIPDFSGKNRFTGQQFHSAQWDHSIDFSGKRVAVIGNAASALQFIPHLATQAKQLTVFQRSPNWVLPKQDRPYSNLEKNISKRLPWLAKLYRFSLWLRCELLLYKMMEGNNLASKWGEREGRRYLKRTIADPVMRTQLTPNYPIGAKRILFSDDYYQALDRDNVNVVTSAITKITETGLSTEDDQTTDADVIIYGTGFKTNPFLASMHITGTNDQSLHDHWNQGAQAYLGITTHGFPNFFMMYGPNTNLGHTSIIVMIESQSRYIVECIETMDRENWKTLEVTETAEKHYNAQLQQRLNKTVWSQTGESWYKDKGKITNNWAGRTFEYIRKTRKVDWNSFEKS
ncbi:flavin-containing monooxygenase [Pseudomaricurvus sp.]|uniref:flavin-containing monooxygenase n=1 Tax=Pseudomaricurvus sp. TaxID=2004510 RepID=UPI003F6D05A1